jgi:predicted nucleotidyltransferase
MTTEEYLTARKASNWKFNRVVADTSFRNVNRIHPIKQNMVKDIVAEAKNDPKVKRIIIFGSSTRYDCDITSDLDVCIDWKDDCYDENGILLPFTINMRKVISSVTKGKADVVNFDYLKGTAVEEAVKEGVAYSKSHDIRYLLSHLEEINFIFEKMDSLNLLSDTITDSEESSRYGKGVRTTIQTVQRVHNIYESMNEAFLKTQEKNNSNL